MIIPSYKKWGVSRKFLLAASTYRRAVGVDQKNLDFSPKAMRDQYEHESNGSPKPDPKINGYTYGKQLHDITLAAMKEDLGMGLFTLPELMQGATALKRKQLRGFKVGRPFWL